MRTLPPRHRGRDARSNASSRNRSCAAAPSPTSAEIKQDALVEQGSASDDLFLLLNGVLVVEVDGEALAELGPGAVLGERAVLEGGTRTATLRAVTECKVAAVPADGSTATSSPCSPRTIDASTLAVSLRAPWHGRRGSARLRSARGRGTRRRR